MTDGLVGRYIQKARKLLSQQSAAGGLSERKSAQIREQLKDCAAGLGGEASARQRAGRLADTYHGLADTGRAAFLRIIATEFGPDPSSVQKAHARYQDTIGTHAQWAAESGLRAAMRSSRLRILTQFNALPHGMKFIVDMRADLLRYLNKDPALQAFDRELEARLGAWFDVGFLELQRISWNSPALLLEKLIEYEAVHQIRSWTNSFRTKDNRENKI